MSNLTCRSQVSGLGLEVELIKRLELPFTFTPDSHKQIEIHPIKTRRYLSQIHNERISSQQLSNTAHNLLKSNLRKSKS
ncbi:hypothetical protein HYALB_00013446 [Hymenoscyphus albidus]|uniref:Uncharacterized protein n=1 Tax=Hymenoscyphus albidus TaxID=595503 RepID=A0A9N9LSY9_9HELO|nr:hypothetical protein HYALB_00013446 [Hymenoscyphus albidus]